MCTPKKCWAGGGLRPTQKSLFWAAPTLWFKGSVTLLLWKRFIADAIPGPPKQRGIEAFHTEGLGLFTMEKVYSVPLLEAC